MSSTSWLVSVSVQEKATVILRAKNFYQMDCAQGGGDCGCVGAMKEIGCVYEQQPKERCRSHCYSLRDRRGDDTLQKHRAVLGVIAA